MNERSINREQRNEIFKFISSNYRISNIYGENEEKNKKKNKGEKKKKTQSTYSDR